MAETTIPDIAAMARATEREAQARVMRDWFNTVVRGWLRNGLIVDYEVRRSTDDRATELHLLLPNSGEHSRLFFAIREEELEMGGLDALRFWLGTIERELVGRREERRGMVGASAAAPPPYRGRGADFIGYEETAAIQRAQMENMNRMADVAALQAYRHGIAWVEGFTIRSGFTEEADTKAKALFIAAAGEAAYQALESGQPIRITGSAGTDYLLFKRASFCVERPSDGARLCAVVPDVPLYDHLLGIKLMVEHDEPAFLATANVSGGARAGQAYTRHAYRQSRLWASSVMNQARW